MYNFSSDFAEIHFKSLLIIGLYLWLFQQQHLHVEALKIWDILNEYINKYNINRRRNSVYTTTKQLCVFAFCGKIGKAF